MRKCLGRVTVLSHFSWSQCFLLSSVSFAHFLPTFFSSSSELNLSMTQLWFHTIHCCLVHFVSILRFIMKKINANTWLIFSTHQRYRYQAFWDKLYSSDLLRGLEHLFPFIPHTWTGYAADHYFTLDCSKS